MTKKRSGTPLGKRTKAQQIADDIARQVRDKLLRPGDSLHTYRELQDHYGVSQSILIKALKDLEERGIIVRQARSGCYITAAAPEIVQRTAGQHVVIPGSASATENASYLLEFSPFNQRATLELFTSDGLAPKLEIWHRVLESFCRTFPSINVRLHWGNQGFESLGFDRQMFDLIHATPVLLRHLGADTFLDARELSSFTCPPDDLLPPIRQAVQTQDRLLGIPFAVMLPCLFRNETIWERVGKPDLRTHSMIELLNRLASLAPACAGLRVDPFYFGSLARAMVYDGALRVLDNLQLELDRARTQALVARLAQSVRNTPTVSADWDEQFLTGNSLLHASFTYFNLVTAAQKNVAVSVMPFPVANEGTAAAQMLMLGVRRETRALPECIELVRFLMQPQIQRQFAEVGDALPARMDALTTPSVPAALGLTTADLDALLPRLNVQLNQYDCSGMLDHDLCRLGWLMAEQKLDVNSVMTQIDIIWDRYRDVARQEMAATQTAVDEPTPVAPP